MHSPAGSAAFDFDELLQTDRPKQTTRYLTPGFSSKLNDDQKATLRKAMTAFSQNQFSETEAYARRITRGAPDAPEGWYVLGLALANQEKYDDAIQALDTSAQYYQENTQPLIVKAEILTAIDRTDEAAQAYEAATAKDPTLWDAHEILGLYAERNGDIPEAQSRFEQAIEHAPANRFYPHLKLANLFLSQRRTEEAVAVLQAYLGTSPNNLEAMASLGHIQRRAGLEADAIKTFTVLTERAPDDPSAAVVLVRALAGAGQVDAALARVQSAIERLDPDIGLQAELGRLLAGKRDYTAAKAAYDAGLALDPDNFVVLKGASAVNQRLGDMPKAIAHARRLTELRPDSANDLIWLANLYEFDGNKDDAIVAYEAALGIAPENWIVQNNLASLISTSDPDRAVDLASKAMTAKPDVSAVQDTLGWAKFLAGDLAGASELFSDLTTANPENANYTLRLGRIQAAQGLKDAARASFKKAEGLDESLSEAVQSLLNDL